MQSNIFLSSIPCMLLLVLIASLASYASAYHCEDIKPFPLAACMMTNYTTGELEGGGSRPGAPNRNDKFGCGDGFINTPLCCKIPFEKVDQKNVKDSCIFAPDGPARK
ncbi:hypothetical protein PGT21_002029 [Puccinia graminis f. sp. tritici]|nr:hypothetical protein PGT21_002029 [Puccinia graminis f. sp. tritici]